MERTVFILFFFTFRSHQRCKKSVQNNKLQSREQNVCVRQTSFSSIFLLNKITMPIFQIIHIGNKTLDQTLASTEVLNERIRSKLVSSIFLPLDNNVKVRRSPRNEVAQGLNWIKESCNNAHVGINSVLSVFLPCLNIGRFCAIIQ